MQKLTIFIILCCLSFITKAQEQGFYSTPYKARNSGSFGESAHSLTICYGVPTTLHGSINGVVDPNRSAFGPVKLLYEFAIRDEIGIAPKILYAQGTWNYTDWSGYTEMKTWAMATGVTGYYHFNKLIPVKQLDLFAGIGFYAGLQKFIWDVRYPSDTDIVPIGTPTISTGARYYFTNGFGAYAEVGFTGGSYIDMGITFRFH